MMSKKVALVCDWLTVVGGAEQVLREIHQLFPYAPIYTSQYRPKKINWFKDTEVKTGWLNFLPAFTRRFIAPLRQSYFKHLDLTAYDLVISVSGCDAKFVKTKKGTHFCYCHVPTQYYWGKTTEYLKDPGFGFLNPVVRPVYRFLLPRLRKKDLEAANRPDFYITISDFAKSEIKKFYEREAKVIFPPVDTKTFSEVAQYKNIKKGNCQIIQEHQNEKSQTKQKTYNKIKYTKNQIAPQQELFQQNLSQEIKLQKNQVSDGQYQDIKNKNSQIEIVENSAKLSNYFINFSRQVSWKRLDLAVKACIKLKEPLVLIGNGPEHKKLIELAKKHQDLIILIDTLPQPKLKEYLEHAKAFLFPSEEPFGIAPVEALAAGCPVIAFKKGGAKDYIIDGKNGLFFESQTVNSLASAIQKFNQLASTPVSTQSKSQNNKQRIVSKNSTSNNSPSSFLSPSEISQTAKRFSKEQFRIELKQFIKQTLGK